MVVGTAPSRGGTTPLHERRFLTRPPQSSAMREPVNPMLPFSPLTDAIVPPVGPTAPVIRPAMAHKGLGGALHPAGVPAQHAEKQGLRLCSQTACTSEVRLCLTRTPPWDFELCKGLARGPMSAPPCLPWVFPRLWGQSEDGSEDSRLERAPTCSATRARRQELGTPAEHTRKSHVLPPRLCALGQQAAQLTTITGGEGKHFSTPGVLMVGAEAASRHAEPQKAKRGIRRQRCQGGATQM